MPASKSLLPFLPRWLKGALLAAVLINFRSLPTYWHWKVWYPALAAHFLARVRGLVPHLRQLPSRGADPFAVVSRKPYRAFPDDCDWNGHLSNSSYAKNLDASRMKACIDLFTPMFSAGGWMALGGADYSFVKEIPALAAYEVEITIAGFGDKWMELQGTFITRPKSKTSKASSTSLPELSPNLLSDASPSHSGTATPITPRVAPRADGAIVHCISVSTYCFKLGRLTIPPAVALSFCGYGKDSNWARTEELFLSKDGKSSSPKRAREWLKEGWKLEEPSILEEFEAKGKRLGQKGEAMRAALASFGLSRED
ncbi:hypothetical protein BDY24DRAFT_382617 [Mrakia frigida]|uniref:uncharacterized protein n=1 Tax=Mrakia frigida TaxID=29902 RepID=UPI003FCBEE77